MGREIRRVPANWEHPKNWQGNPQPLYDRGYEDEAAKWHENYVLWMNGQHPSQLDGRERESPLPTYFWDWDGPPPDRTYYRPTWADEERTHYQVYETVSEGTPVSPVFATEDEVVAWLVEQGHSEGAAREFVRLGWAPSGMLATSRSGGTVFMDGITAMEFLPPKQS